jgi:hypothetical protein
MPIEISYGGRRNARKWPGRACERSITRPSTSQARRRREKSALLCAWPLFFHGSPEQHHLRGFPDLAALRLGHGPKSRLPLSAGVSASRGLRFVRWKQPMRDLSARPDPGKCAIASCIGQPSNSDSAVPVGARSLGIDWQGGPGHMQV